MAADEESPTLRVMAHAGTACVVLGVLASVLVAGGLVAVGVVHPAQVQAGRAAVLVTALGLALGLVDWVVAGTRLRRRGHGWWTCLAAGFYVAYLVLPHFVLSLLNTLLTPVFALLEIFSL